MARYETYQSNAAEAPVMRKWLVWAFFLSLALHAGLIVCFQMKRLDRFDSSDAPRLAPPTEILTRVRIPQMPDENLHVKLPASGPSSVPTPPTSDITTALVETSNPKRCGATNPRSNG